MSIPTNHEILQLLGRLDREVADNLETEQLEVKPWQGPKESLREAIEYAVCFANADGGVIVFGILDHVRGRNAAIQGAKGYRLDAWRRDIFAAIRPNLSVQVEELDVPEGTGKLLLVRVAKGGNGPYGTANGLYKIRIGKNCMPLDPQAYLRRQVSTGVLDWSGLPAEGVTRSDLDPVEIARARNVLRGINPGSGLLNLDDEAFLAGLGAVRGGRVTHTGLLLLGQEQILSERCPQHQVHYVQLVSDTAVARNDSYHSPLLKVLSQIELAFTGPANPEQEVTVGLFKLRIPAYPVEVVREAVLNAVTHRDYTQPGEVLIRHMKRELVITSPGGFLADITPDNILRHEPLSRNPALAQAFQKLGLVERAGIGRHRIFLPSLSFGKRVPQYETDGLRVTLRIFDGTFDYQMAAMVARWKQEGREFDLDSLLVLTFFKDNAFIDTLSASKLLQRPRDEVREILDHLAQPRVGILERRGRTKAATYHLAKAVAKDLLGKAGYTKTRGLDPIRFAEMVKAFVADHGSITPQECRELLGLGESQTARVEASRYLSRWSGKGGFLRREGKPPKVRYYPVEGVRDTSVS